MLKSEKIKAAIKVRNNSENILREGENFVMKWGGIGPKYWLMIHIPYFASTGSPPPPAD